jgi:ethanolamine ammonia-lyase large subunit
MLSQDEVDNVMANLGKIINQKALETIHAARGNRRAMANFFLKPVVVSVIKQRSILTYEVDDVMDALEELGTGDIDGIVSAA